MAFGICYERYIALGIKSQGLIALLRRLERAPVLGRRLIFIASLIKVYCQYISAVFQLHRILGRVTADETGSNENSAVRHKINAKTTPVILSDNLFI